MQQTEQTKQNTEIEQIEQHENKTEDQKNTMKHFPDTILIHMISFADFATAHSFQGVSSTCYNIFTLKHQKDWKSETKYSLKQLAVNHTIDIDLEKLQSNNYCQLFWELQTIYEKKIHENAGSEDSRKPDYVRQEYTHCLSSTPEEFKLFVQNAFTYDLPDVLILYFDLFIGDWKKEIEPNINECHLVCGFETNQMFNLFSAAVTTNCRLIAKRLLKLTNLQIFSGALVVACLRNEINLAHEIINHPNFVLKTSNKEKILHNIFFSIIEDENRFVPLNLTLAQLIFDTSADPPNVTQGNMATRMCRRAVIMLGEHLISMHPMQGQVIIDGTKRAAAVIEYLLSLDSTKHPIEVIPLIRKLISQNGSTQILKLMIQYEGKKTHTVIHKTNVFASELMFTVRKQYNHIARTLLEDTNINIALSREQSQSTLIEDLFSYNNYEFNRVLLEHLGQICTSDEEILNDEVPTVLYSVEELAYCFNALLQDKFFPECKQYVKHIRDFCETHEKFHCNLKMPMQVVLYINCINSGKIVILE